MNQVSKLKKLAKLSCFDKNTLAQILDLSDNSLYSNIKRWIKSGVLIQLKKGLYVTGAFLSAQQDPTDYAEFLANKLREPSYLSSEYVLQKYQILSEAVYGYTSISLKSKKNYRNKLGVFSYNGINKNLFSGFVIKNSGKFSIFEATKAKALFDYLYLKLFRTQLITMEMFDSFRLNLEEFSKADLQEFRNYCKATNIKKYAQVAKIIGDKIDNQRTRKSG